MDYSFTVMEIYDIPLAYLWCQENFGSDKDRWKWSFNQYMRAPDDPGPEYLLIEIRDETDAMAYKLRWE